MKRYIFKEAVPVWEEGTENELNYNLVFRTIVNKAEKSVVNVSASNMYQMKVNGEMVSEGPARAGHGYYRVDEIDISHYLTFEKNIITIYVNNYYVKNYYLIKQPGFLCAEVISDGKVVAATGREGFVAKYHNERIRKVDRSSFQRTFAEAYRMDLAYKDFETKADCNFEEVKLSCVDDKRFIARGVPYPCYDEYLAKEIISFGEFTYLKKPDEFNMQCAITKEDAYLKKGFMRQESECYVIDEIEKCKCRESILKLKKAKEFEIGGLEYVICDIGTEKTGFIMLDVECSADTEIILSFEEILTDGDISTKRSGITNGVVWFLKCGSYSLITNEPNSLRYIKIANNSSGKILVKKLGIKEFAFDYKAKELGSDNKKLNEIYRAAVETFRQNTLDIYMDCPSRERAGWLCDSYFTAMVEMHLTGKSVVERNFLENFIISEGFNDIPDYMFSMCYPADSAKGYYIPNWAMWYVIELGEYFERSGDKELVDIAKDKIMRLNNYFEGLRNSDGLLENLENWVFVEWSKANEFVQNVNYPSNMLYAKMLRTMGKLYDEKYIKEAEKIEDTIRNQSFYNGFFHDHAVRDSSGNLCVADKDITETCQYYAFFTEIATPQTHPDLWQVLLNDFGPEGKKKGLWSEIFPSNAFIGNYLRLCLLEKYDEIPKLLENIEGYFYYMAQQTGTLWEHTNSTASCNHGFASLVAVWLEKYADKCN